MRLYQQLILFMLAATVLPLALLGFYLLRSAEAELAQRIAAEQRARATAIAAEAGASILEPVNAVTRATDAIEWTTLSAEESRGGLSLVYQQAPGVSAVVVVGPDGTVRSGPVFLADGTAGRPVFQEGDLAELLRAVPLSSLRAGGKGQVALSPAFARKGAAAASLAIAVKLADGPDASFLLAELPLTALQGKLRSEQGGPEMALVDGGGRVLVSASAGEALRQVPEAVWKNVLTEMGQSAAAQARVSEQLVSLARLPRALGLFALVTVEERAALSSIRALRRTVLGSIAAGVAVLLIFGFAFTQRLNRRIGRAAEGAEAFARGELSHRIPVTGADELTDLAETFNRMGSELQAAHARLERWNDDLRVKVDEATADLKTAQAQLIEAQKLAAVGQLGAGVAHEINNPLAGILGHTQLLMLERTEQDPDFASLKKIEQSAKRCKEITQNLLRFSQQREKAELRPTDLNAVVRDAISLTESQLKGEGVALDLKTTRGALMVRGDPAQLSQVVLALISNARTAMRASSKRELQLSTSEHDGRAVLRVVDSGKGISPENLPRIFEPFFTTKEVWSNVGLGLSVAYRVVAEHQGKIEVTSQHGEGAAFTIEVPRIG